MTDLNKVILIGRVTHDINDKSFGYIGNGNAKLTLSIAVNRSVKRGDQWEDEVSFFEVILWGKPAENLKSHIAKGKRIAVSGELRQERWEKDGQKYSKIVVNAESVQLLDSAKSDKEGFAAKEEKAPTLYRDETNDIPF